MTYEEIRKRRNLQVPKLNFIYFKYFLKDFLTFGIFVRIQSEIDKSPKMNKYRFETRVYTFFHFEYEGRKKYPQINHIVTIELI